MIQSLLNRVKINLMGLSSVRNSHIHYRSSALGLISFMNSTVDSSTISEGHQETKAQGHSPVLQIEGVCDMVDDQTT